MHWMNYLLKSYVPNVMFRFCNIKVYDIWTFPYDSENENIVYFGQFLLLLIVQLLRGVWLFVTPQTIAYQASLSTISASWLKLTSIESVVPSNRLILCPQLLRWPSVFPSIRVFPNESALHIRRPKYRVLSLGKKKNESLLIMFPCNYQTTNAPWCLGILPRKNNT